MQDNSETCCDVWFGNDRTGGRFLTGLTSRAEGGGAERKGVLNMDVVHKGENECINCSGITAIFIHIHHLELIDNADLWEQFTGL